MDVPKIFMPYVVVNLQAGWLHIDVVLQMFLENEYLNCIQASSFLLVT